MRGTWYPPNPRLHFSKHIGGIFEPSSKLLGVSPKYHDIPWYTMGYHGIFSSGTYATVEFGFHAWSFLELTIFLFL